MPKIIPTVGRIMLYHYAGHSQNTTPWASIVTCVYGEDLVNICAFDEAGTPSPRVRVPVVQEGSKYTAGASPYVSWMEYQKNQAAKYEALEEKLKA
jgi:hypothetical protein